MTDEGGAAKDAGTAANEDPGLRRKLIVRGIAGAAIIAALIGALAVYDALNRPAPPPQAMAPPVTPPPAAVPPEPAAGKQAESAPAATPVPPAAEPAGQTEAAPKGEPAAEPERTGAPAPVAASREPQLPAAAPAAPTQAAAQGKAADRLKLSPPAAPAAAPQREAGAAAPGYLVQVGVFSNAANAEELRARLTLNGIPSQVELRVQAGPFATRREAQDATNKLKALGITSTMLVPARR